MLDTPLLANSLTPLFLAGALVALLLLLLLRIRNQSRREFLRARQRQADAEGRFSLAFQNGNDPMTISLKDGTILDVNQVFCEVSGYRPDELVGYSSLALGLWVHPEEQRTRMLNLLKENGRVRNMEAEFRNKAGDIVPTLLSVSLLTLEGRECLLSTIHDLSSIRAMERKNRKLEQELDQIRNLEAMGTLLGGLAHQFNNLLTSIIGYGELALDDIDADSPAARDLERILNKAGEARGLVEQILCFGNHRPQSKEPVRLRPFLEDLADKVRLLAPPGLRIEARLSDQDVRIAADPVSIGQALLNICRNGIEAMEGDGMLIIGMQYPTGNGPGFAEVDQDLPAGDYVHLYFKDTGQGMAKDAMDRIFTPFYTTKQHGVGTGMGLSVAHGIIRAHDGLVRVHSRRGYGSTFHLFFPVIEGGGHGTDS